MRTYIYSYIRKRNTYSGGARHFVTVHRIKKNKPYLIKAHYSVGYRSPLQAVCELLGDTREFKNAWRKSIDKKVNIIEIGGA